MGLNLNLRQIIRNQKTKNFDLISLISEKDEEQVKYKDKEDNPSTMDVSVALRQPEDHPARIAAEKARILLENLTSGQSAILRFKGKDTAKTLPKTLEEDGFKITNYLFKKKEVFEIEVFKK